jgi:hypothetical protein
MFDVFGRLLKPGGRAVVLCANSEMLLKAAGGGFILQSSVPILLSGKKTEIFVFVSNR